MKKLLFFAMYVLGTIITITPDIYAGKGGAALGGFIGGTIVGSALSAPRERYHYPRETVVVHETQPVTSTSRTTIRLRAENQELREDNRYLQDENRSLNRENKKQQQETDTLHTENLLLQKENKQLERNIARLEAKLEVTENELKKIDKDMQNNTQTENTDTTPPRGKNITNPAKE